MDPDDKPNGHEPPGVASEDRKTASFLTLSSKDIPSEVNGSDDYGANEKYDHLKNQVTMDEADKKYSLAQRYAISIANRPCTHFFTSLILSIVIGILGMWLGEFEVSVDNAGWNSRGTLISDRHTQVVLVHQNRFDLWSSATRDNGLNVWDDLTRNIQPGWESDDDAVAVNDDSLTADTVQNQNETDKNEDGTRRMQSKYVVNGIAGVDDAPFAESPGWGRRLSRGLNYPWLDLQGKVPEKEAESRPRRLLPMTPDFKRRLQEEAATANASAFHLSPVFMAMNNATSDPSHMLSGCDVSWYFSPSLYEEERLWPIWRAVGGSSVVQSDSILKEQFGNSILNGDNIRAICEAEQKTQQVLVDNEACVTCGESKCLPPYSIVLFVRTYITGGFTMDCATLASTWESEYYTLELHNQFIQCAKDLNALQGLASIEENGVPESCPNDAFTPILLDEFFGKQTLSSSDDQSAVNNRLEYTSSVFATFSRSVDIDVLYEIEGQFSRGTQESDGSLVGVYDTQNESFNNLLIDESLGSDMILALASAVVTFLAMVVHTRSLFLSVVGLVQVILSFPLAFFFYTFVAQLTFFPFLNFIGIFVVFALGADDVFVAVDKWKNARIKAGFDAPTEQVAAAAFPDAAMAMFLTSFTTAIAFFSTATCPVVRSQWL
jgi:Patched family